MGEIRSSRAFHSALKISSGLLLAAALLAPSGGHTALAWERTGWKWAHPGLTYAFVHNGTDNVDFPGWDQGYVDRAAADWSRSPTPVSIAASSSASAAQITVIAYTTSDGAGGHGGCTHYDTQGNCDHGQVSLFFGTTSTGMTGSRPDTPQFDEYEAMHEFGHVLGLAHSCVLDSVMSGPNPDKCPNQGYNMSFPTSATQDDIDGLNAIYPGYGGSGTGCAPSTLNILTLPGRTHC